MTNYRPAAGAGDAPTHHCCFSGLPTCSGCNPCPACRNMIKQAVILRLLQAFGFTSAADVHRFLEIYDMGFDSMHYAMGNDPRVRNAFVATDMTPILRPTAPQTSYPVYAPPPQREVVVDPRTGLPQFVERAQQHQQPFPPQPLPVHPMGGGYPFQGPPRSADPFDAQPMEPFDRSEIARINAEYNQRQPEPVPVPAPPPPMTVGGGFSSPAVGGWSPPVPPAPTPASVPESPPTPKSEASPEPPSITSRRNFVPRPSIVVSRGNPSADDSGARYSDLTTAMDPEEIAAAGVRVNRVVLGNVLTSTDPKTEDAASDRLDVTNGKGAPST